jgi:hypothetical protein
MGRGRPPKGAQLVDSLKGSVEAKAKLKVVLETLAGARSVEEACRELGLGTTAFHELRNQTLQTMVQQLEPRPRGRPKQAAAATEADLAALKAENWQLQMKLRGLQIREEIAVAMPHLLKKEAAEALKKTNPGPPRPPAE